MRRILQPLRRVALGTSFTRHHCHNYYRHYHFTSFHNVDSFHRSVAIQTTTRSFVSDEGERYYKQALYLLEQEREEKQNEEESNALEQYQAMMKQTHSEPEPQTKNRAAGVAVVKTITRQTQKQQRKIQEVKKRLSVKEKEHNANYCLQKAAFQYGHSSAFLRLGNMAYQEANQSQSKDQSDYHADFLKNHLTIVDMSYLESASWIKRAIYLYQLATSQQQSKEHHAEAYYNIGNIFWNGYPIVDYDQQEIPKDRMKAMDSFYHAINLGDVDAKYFVGVTLLWSSKDDDVSTFFWKQQQKIKGETYNNDISMQKEGLRLIEEAANDDHEGALYYLALYYKDGDERLNIPPCTRDDFQSRLNKAAKGGDADALYLLAHCYYYGEDGYDQNASMALENYIKASKAGNSDAAISAAAIFHRNGEKRKAFEYYQEAADMGNIEGWRNLVSCYALGDGIPKCRNTAEYIAKTMLTTDETTT